MVGCASNSLVDKSSLNVREANNRSSDYDGREVQIYGYVEYGFDGHHAVCSISHSKRGSGRTDSIWLVDQSCFDLAQEKKFRKGFAVVTGEFNDIGGQTFRSGDVYISELILSDIAWK